MVTPVLQYQLVVLAVPVVLSLSGGIFSFILMPALDIILGHEVHEGEDRTTTPEVYRAVLWAFATFHFLLLFTTCALVATHALSPLAFAGTCSRLMRCTNARREEYTTDKIDNNNRGGAEHGV